MMDALKDRGMTWMSRLRLRAIVFVIGIPLAAFGAISLGPGWLALPLVGVAVAAVTMTLSKLGHRADQRICWTCGTDLSGEPEAEQGVACPTCGSLQQHNPALANAEVVEDDSFSPDDSKLA
jgi:hypothetical protein